MRKGFIINLKPLTGLSLNAKRLVANRVVGSYKSVFRGRGLEFGGYRTYTPGDDASLIDWKASVRTGETLIKEFVEERNLTVFFLIDVSNSMLYSSFSKLKSEYTAELVSSLSFVVLHAGDSIGFVLFSDKIIKQIMPFNGEGRHSLITKELLRIDNYGGGYDLAHALKYTGSFLQPQSVLIIISDFIGLKEGWDTHLKLAAQKYSIIGMMVRDPRDKRLPDMSFGSILLESPYGEEQIVVDPKKVAKPYQDYVVKQEKKIKDTFLRAEADFLSLTSDKDFVIPLLQFFKERERRLT